ncbi:hypothetical protein JCM19300_1798 [Algibacter lectus]|uniref:Uncharacterized protein n=1 Tax=Algibacter lectus TaxID=221126 RepID=A0A090W7G3_9FLAO|nr:hypothetical protein JCM19300_1798 [Algibacter lectus]
MFANEDAPYGLRLFYSFWLGVLCTIKDIAESPTLVVTPKK